MSEMVERIARVLCERSGKNPDNTDGGSGFGGASRVGEPAWEAWADDARAVIEAMREPTEAMEAAGDACDEPSELGTCADASTHWAAMIAAALKDDA